MLCDACQFSEDLDGDSVLLDRIRCNEKEEEQVLGAGVRKLYMDYKIMAGRKNRSIVGVVRITAENNAISRNHHRLEWCLDIWRSR